MQSFVSCSSLDFLEVVVSSVSAALTLPDPVYLCDNVTKTFSKEKWDASGGNEALGRASAAIPESTRQIVGSLFKREQIRGPAVYFGIGEERPFYIEKTPSLLMERLRHNMTFFYLNYMILTGVLFCLTLLVSPSAIIGIGLLAAAWLWLVKASQDGSLRIGCKLQIFRILKHDFYPNPGDYVNLTSSIFDLFISPIDANGSC